MLENWRELGIKHVYVITNHLSDDSYVIHLDRDVLNSALKSLLIELGFPEMGGRVIHSGGVSFDFRPADGDEAQPLESVVAQNDGIIVLDMLNHNMTSGTPKPDYNFCLAVKGVAEKVVGLDGQIALLCPDSEDSLRFITFFDPGIYRCPHNQFFTWPVLGKLDTEEDRDLFVIYESPPERPENILALFVFLVGEGLPWDTVRSLVYSICRKKQDFFGELLYSVRKLRDTHMTSGAPYVDVSSFVMENIPENHGFDDPAICAIQRTLIENLLSCSAGYSDQKSFVALRAFSILAWEAGENEIILPEICQTFWNDFRKKTVLNDTEKYWILCRVNVSTMGFFSHPSIMTLNPWLSQIILKARA